MKHNDYIELAEMAETKSFMDGTSVMIPHKYANKKDIEISGIITSWLIFDDERKSIAMAERILGKVMDNKPYEYIVSDKWCQYKDDYTCLFSFITWHNFAMLCNKLKCIYYNHGDLEAALASTVNDKKHKHTNYYNGLCELLSGETMIQTGDSSSSCFRANLFLRWMARKNSPVDLGIWKDVSENKLFVSCDANAIQQSKYLGITSKLECNFKNMEAITKFSREIFYKDPSRMDYVFYALRNR